MKENKILYYSAIALFTLIWTSCDSLLDVSPETDMTDENFWKTELHLKGACNKLYEQLSIFGADGHDIRADDQVGVNPNSISNGQRSVPTTSADWTDPYRRIFNANNIIEKAPSAGLYNGQTDEGDLGVTYNSIDEYLSSGSCAPDDMEVIANYHKHSEHKRNPPAVYED